MLKRKSKNILILLLLIIVTMATQRPCQAQSNSGNAEILPSLSQSSSWALQFSVNKYFTLAPFSGALLAVKKQLSDQSALRVSIRIDIEAIDQSSENALFLVDLSSYAQTHFQIQYLNYTKMSQRVNLYFGLGPELGLNYQPKYTFINAPEYTIYDNFSRNYWKLSIGLQGLIGAEWIIQNQLGIYCEYSGILEYSYAWSDEEDDDSKLSMISLLSLPIRFGISVYF